MVFLFTVGSSALFIPSSISAVAKQDSWLAILIGMLVNVFVIGVYLLLSKMTSGRNLFELIQQLCGKWIGAVLILLIVIISFLLAGVTPVLFEVGYFLNTQLFTKTPIIVLNAMFALIIVFALRLGLRTFARASELLVPYFVFFLIIMLVSVSPEMELAKLQPIFQTGLKPLLLGTLYFNSLSCFPLIFFLTIYPTYVSEQKKAAKGFLLGTTMGGGVLLLMAFIGTSVLGAENSAHYIFPSYVLAQRINIGGFFTRIEVFMSALWLISLFFKMLIYFYAAIQGLGRLTTVKSTKIFTLPLGIIAVVLSVKMFPDTLSFNDWTKKTLPLLGLFYGVFLPVLLIVIAHFRKKHIGPNV